MFFQIDADSKPTSPRDPVSQWFKLIQSTKKKTSPPQQGFFKKCWNFILNVLYWLILIPILLVIGIIFLTLQFIFKLIQILYRRLRQTGSIKGWREELGNEYPNLKEAAKVFVSIFYHLVGLPAYLLGVLVIILLKLCKVELGKVYEKGKSKIGFKWQKNDGQGGQKGQNNDKKAQIKQLKQKITQMTQKLSLIRQAYLSSTIASQQLSSSQSTKITQLTQQLQQTTKLSQTKQKSVPTYEQKFKQYHERLANISGQITKLKLQHEFEVEKVTIEKNVVIEGLEERIKELGQAGSKVMNRTLDSSEIVEEQGEGEDWQDDSESEEQEEEEIVEQNQIPRQNICYEKQSSNKLSDLGLVTLKVVFFLLSVNVARLFSKLIQTQSSP